MSSWLKGQESPAPDKLNGIPAVAELSCGKERNGRAQVKPPPMTLDIIATEIFKPELNYRKQKFEESLRLYLLELQGKGGGWGGFPILGRLLARCPWIPILLAPSPSITGILPFRDFWKKKRKSLHFLLRAWWL